MGILFFAIVFAIVGIVGVNELVDDFKRAKSKKQKPSYGCLILLLVVFAISAWLMYMALINFNIIKPQTSVQKTKPAITATPVPIQSIIRKSDYDYEPEYIGNKHSYKFHYAWCSSVDDMYEGNKVYGKSREYLINNGYKPCKRCDP